MIDSTLFTDVARTVVTGIDSAILVYFLALNGFYALLLVLSVPEVWAHWQQYKEDGVDHYLHTDALPGISVLVPAYNMAESIVQNVTCLLALKYSRHEVVIVNDGSRDATMALLRRHFELYEVPRFHGDGIETATVTAYYRSRTEPRLLVIDKSNGGKADALNAALNAARYPLCLSVDADTLVEHDALIRLARAFVLDPHVAAAGATIRIANGCTVRNYTVEDIRVPREALPALQVPEYMRAFLFGRLGFNAIGGNMVVSGAFGIFRRDYLMDIRGYRTDSVAEDMDLVVRLHRHLREMGVRYSIPFIPDPVAWTEVPLDLKTLGNQRERWHRGLIATLAGNMPMLFHPRYGRIGSVVFPYFFFGEMIAPLIELTGVLVCTIGLGMGLVDWSFALLFIAAAWGYGMFITLAAVVMDELTFCTYARRGDFARLVLAALLEPFGYRQMTVLWRLRSFWRAFRRQRHWGEMKRHGFANANA